ncbi:uncharacterized protein LOC113794074 [Dermatophagoides pteronyssinus]|uniref:uncharacterized protein LOC113794074 n=1 Tax=Dermatophagoides pteronyssinus TaxID=6956 RepID=UPI003F6687BA
MTLYSASLSSSLLVFTFTFINVVIQFMFVNGYYGPPKSFGYKTETYHPIPRSYVYHEQHFPKISKSYYEHERPKLYNRFNDHDDGFKFDHYQPPMKRQIITYHHQPPAPIMKKKEKENDSIKFSVDIPVKNMDFGKGLEKEIMNVHDGLAEHTKSSVGGHDEYGGTSGGGGDNNENGYGDEKEMKKDLSIPEISIPKFDVDGMLDKIK